MSDSPAGTLRLSYWLLFDRSENLQRGTGERIAAHEGDWERIDVVVRRGPGRDRYTPESVIYYAEGRARVVSWSDVTAVEGSSSARSHPVVYLARASHTPYSRPGRHLRRARSSYDGSWRAAVDDTEACAACPIWRTWEHLRDVRREPWYGYRGGWGARGTNAESTGPAGPEPR